MGENGDTCVRCGKRPASGTSAGVPTCESCEELLKASITAKGEGSRQCPIDSTEMTKEIVSAIVIDRCPSCNGVWLDGGELDLLKQAVDAGIPVDFARQMLFPWPEDQAEGSP